MRGKFLLVALAVLVAVSAGIGFVEVISAAPSKAPMPHVIADRLTVKGPTNPIGPLYYTHDGVDEVLANTWTMTVDKSFYALSSAGTVTSDATTAINDGQYAWQTVKLFNAGSQSIVVKNGANTDLGSGDVTLGGTDYLELLWDPGTTKWTKIGTADN